MDERKRAALEADGFKVGDTQDFLGLTDAEMELIDMRIALAKQLRKKRQARKVSQAAFAARIGSSQSRVAKMEKADPSVSFDLLVRSLVMAGSTRGEIAGAIAHSSLA